VGELHYDEALRNFDVQSSLYSVKSWQEKVSIS